MKLHYGDLLDSLSLIKLIREIQPTEIYNLGAQSHVKVRKGTVNVCQSPVLPCGTLNPILVL